MGILIKMSDKLMKRGPYRRFRNVAVPKLLVRAPVAAWRTEAPLKEETPGKRVGQYVGPVWAQESIAIHGVRFEFEVFSDNGFFLKLSDDFTGKRLQTNLLSKGSSTIKGPENTKINLFAYYVSEEMVRYSITMEKNE